MKMKMKINKENRRSGLRTCGLLAAQLAVNSADVRTDEGIDHLQQERTLVRQLKRNDATNETTDRNQQTEPLSNLSPLTSSSPTSSRTFDLMPLSPSAVISCRARLSVAFTFMRRSGKESRM
jgi:hypothetical protein